MAGPRLLFQLAQEADDEVRQSVEAQLLAAAGPRGEQAFERQLPDFGSNNSHLTPKAGNIGSKSDVRDGISSGLILNDQELLAGNGDTVTKPYLAESLASMRVGVGEQLPLLPPPYSVSARIPPISSPPAYSCSGTMAQVGINTGLHSSGTLSSPSVVSVNATPGAPYSNSDSQPTSMMSPYHHQNLTDFNPIPNKSQHSQQHLELVGSSKTAGGSDDDNNHRFVAGVAPGYISHGVVGGTKPHSAHYSIASYTPQHHSSPAGGMIMPHSFSSPQSNSKLGSSHQAPFQPNHPHHHQQGASGGGAQGAARAYMSSPAALSPSELRMTQSYPDVAAQLRAASAGAAGNVYPKQMTPPPISGITRGDQNLCSGSSSALWQSPERPNDSSPPGQQHDQSIIHAISEENRTLRSELEGYIRKTFRLQQLELHYQRVQREYDDLVRRQEKREKLEQHVVERLQREMGRLRERNRELTDQVELVSESARQEERSWEDELQHELSRRNFIISELVTQNQELQATKYRHDIELEAQRSTLEEQRAHIQLLDKALNNQQDRCTKLELELKTKTEFEQRCVQLERALQAVREATERREESHRKHRAQLEKQLAQLHMQKSKDSHSSHTVIKKPGVVPLGVDPDCVIINRLQEELDRKEFELQNAQAELLVMDHSHGSSSKEDRKSSDEDRKSTESDSRKSTEEKWATIKKLSEMEMKIKGLEDRVAEKDAMIKVLRRHNTTDHSIAPQLWAVNDYSGSLTSKTRWRLEAVKKRLVASPREMGGSTFSTSSASEATAAATSAITSTASDSKLPFLPSTVYHKLTLEHSGIDSDSGAFSVRPNRHHHRGLHHLIGESVTAGASSHSRTQSSCESCLYGDLRSGTAGFSVPTTPALDGYIKRPQIYTLPTVRRARGKGSIDSIRGRSGRPKSADDHLLHGVRTGDRLSASTEAKESSHDTIRIVLNQEDDEDSGSKTESAEQLYHC